MEKLRGVNFAGAVVIEHRPTGDVRGKAVYGGPYQGQLMLGWYEDLSGLYHNVKFMSSRWSVEGPKEGVVRLTRVESNDNHANYEQPQADTVRYTVELDF